MKKRKIAFLIYNLSGGGAERVTALISSHLIEIYETSIILFENDQPKFNTKANIIKLNIPSKKGIFKLINSFKRIMELKKIKKNENFDVVISFLPFVNLYNIITKSKEKTIVSIRSYKSVDYNKYSINKLIDKFIYTRCDSILACSKLIKEKIEENFKKGFKTKVIYNPIDRDLINEKACQPMDIDFLKWKGDNKILISVGKFIKYKGYDELIDAFCLVKKEVPKIKLVLIGKDYMNGYLENKIKQLKLEDSILLLPFDTNPFRYMKNCHLFVLSSYYEGFPNVVIEAMCCGLPIVSVNCPSGPKEILMENAKKTEIRNTIKGDYGILCPEIDVHNDSIKKDRILELSKGIKIGLTLNNYYSNKSLERINDFDIHKIVNQYVNFIEETLVDEPIN